MEHKYWLFTLLLLFIGAGIFTACKKAPERIPQPPTQSEVKHLDWAKNAVVYEVNIRQFSKEGTFMGFSRDLPRLKEMGVDIVWLMPINPIGEKFRKGPLGSYYSVRDYSSVNPEFGTLEDFKTLVKLVHEQGMKIIIDWVPNHTSWDNNLVKTHPDYYMRDSLGKFSSPFDWTDVIRLDYTKPATRRYMIETMRWWVTETDIDGFRCDVAHMVPVDFWNEWRAAMDSTKPMFQLAESDQPFLHEKAFDATYDWKFHHIMNQVAQGKQPALAIRNHFTWVDTTYPGNSYLLQFTSNHDENSWNGTEYERMREGAKSFAVLAATVRDMFLIYNGQESAFNRRLKFFEKDSISWENYPLADFYKSLIDFKKRNKVLWNGSDGARMQFLATGNDSTCLAFVRSNEEQKVLAVFNFSGQEQKVNLKSDKIPGKYRELFSGIEQSVGKKASFTLKAWEYLVFESAGKN
jgi:glycosidase